MGLLEKTVSQAGVTRQESHVIDGTLTGPDGQRIRWHIAEEVPVALTFNGSTTVVMMATPADLEDFAVGFAVTEDMVQGPGDVEEVLSSETPDGILVDVLTDPKRKGRRAVTQRTMEGRTGCGLCGVDSLKEAVRPPREVSRRFAFDPAAMEKAFDALRDHQPLNRINHSVHAAAWCAPDGAIRAAREDVGRHNALDKLLGAVYRAGEEPADGFVIMSSRCSFELVQKAAVAGVPYLATVSAPTTLALDLAAKSGMRLAAMSREGLVVLDENGNSG